MKPVDLKLLAVFDAIYEHRSVSKAAQRLNLTQSAVSHALRRLRATIGDPLFLRSGRGLQPSSRAREMAPAVRDGLARLQAATAPVDFDPATAVRTFTLAAGSYFCALLIPRLIAKAREVAGGVTFRILPVGPDLLAELDDGNVDLALGAFATVPRRLIAEPLFREGLVWIASQGGSSAQRLTPDEVARKPHLVIATRRPFEPVRALLGDVTLEGFLDPSGSRKRGRDSGTAAAIVYDAVTAAALVAHTDMVALVPRRLAQSEQPRFGLRILEPSGKSRGIDLAMVTHRRASEDAGLVWLRSQIAELSR